MTAEQFWSIMYPILIALSMGIAGLIGFGFKFVHSYAAKKLNMISNEDDRALATSFLNSVEDLISTAVSETNQTLVDNLKQANADGKLTPEEIRQAFQQTYTKTKDLMGAEAYAKLSEILPDAETWIQSKIEHYVNISK